MKLKLMLLNVGLLSLIASGCGQNLNGSYTGTETFQQTAATGTTGSFVPSGYGSSFAQITTMTLSQNGDSVTGNYTETISSGASTSMTGTITGTMSGGSLSNVQMYPSGTMATSVAGSSCDYTGTLNIGSNNMLSGTLTALGSVTGGGYGNCTGYTAVINLNQTGS
jgi:hypothetical protein